MFTPQEAINRLCDKREIFYDEMVDLMRQVMEGKVPPVQMAAILMGPRPSIPYRIRSAAALSWISMERCR